MITYNIDPNTLKQVERKLGAFRKDEAPRALKNAINATAKDARRDLAREAKKKYVVQVSAMTIKNATKSNLEAILGSKGNKIPLGKFSSRAGTLGSERYYNPTLHVYQTGKGGTGATGKMLKGSHFKQGGNSKLKWFIAKMGSGHKGIFQRNAGKTRGQRGEVSEIMGKAAPEVYGDEFRVYGIVRPNIESNLQKNINKQVEKILS